MNIYTSLLPLDIESVYLLINPNLLAHLYNAFDNCYSLLDINFADN